MSSSVLTILLLIVVCFGIGLCDVYQINISPNQPCPNDYCFTLPQFVNDFTNLSYGEYNITLVFLSGNHTLPSQLLFQDFTMVSLFSQFDIPSNSTESVIVCDDNGRFEFLNVSTVQVSRLTFIGCTGNSVEDVNQFLLKDSNFIGRQGQSGTALKLYHTSAVIVKSSFSHYDGDTYGTVNCTEFYASTATAGSAIFMRSSNATIELSKFEGNRAEIGGAVYTLDSDILTIINCTFVENNASLIFSLPHTVDINFCFKAGGGALYTRDTKNVTLINSNFTENLSQFHGGAVSVLSESATTVTITDSEFNGNSADGGGAVAVKSASSITVTITDSEFNGNSADSGGAVVVYSDTSMTFTITDSEFNGNSSDYGGGAVSASITVTITDSEFNGNSARYGGGAVRVCSDSSTTFTISNSEFNGNSAYYSGAVEVYSFSDYGGAVDINFSLITFTITDSEFNGNSANYGGALTVYSYSYSFIISQTNFSNNNALSGGVLYFSTLAEFSNSESHELTMSNSIFIKNRAHGTGGVLWTRYATVTSHNVQFINNSASEGGGVIYSSEKSNINISNCNITLNSVDRNGYGGVAYLQQDTIITVFNSFISRNRAEHGGVMWAQRSTIETINVTFIDNYANSDGGVFYSDQSHTNISQNKFSNNHADNNGGTVYADGGSTRIVNSNFSHNSAGSDGAVMRAYLNELMLMKCDFNNNSADYEGGVLWIDQCSLNVIETKFSDNIADRGGAINLEMGDTVLNITSFMNNTANAGGALWASYATVTSHNVQFINNSASEGGGVIYSSEKSNINISNCNITLNSVDRNGYGGVAYLQQDTIITVFNSFISRNRAEHGGVMWAQRSTIETINVTFIDNYANSDGGVFYSDQSRTNISQNKFSNNHADNNGGTVYADGGSTRIVNSNFSHNSASSDGAVMRAYLNELMLMKCDFNNNSADYEGGVLWIDQCSLNVIETKFSDNIADHGGAINLEMGDTVLNITSFMNNTANAGGALWASYATVTSHNVQFINNSASEGGGVIYSAEKSNINISNCNITLNSVDRNGYGGVAYLQQDTIITVFNSFISRNRAEHGGVMWAQRSTIETINVTFIDNYANSDGGVFYFDQSHTNISQNKFSNNHADNNGGTVYADGGSTRIVNSNFSHNSAGSDGAVMRAYLNELMLMKCDFNNNSADYEGGVLWTDQCSLNVIETKFSDNIAECGGAIHLEMGDTVLNITSFMNNTANAGGALWASKTSINSFSTNITRNSAKSSVLYLLSSNTVWSSITLSDNIGSMLSQRSVVIIEGKSFFVNNIQPPLTTTVNLRLEGGAITAVLQSNITLKGICQFQNNSADKGGALNVVGSMVDVHDKVTIAMNKATVCGGGMYLYHSSLTSRADSTLTLFQNEGTEKGGGVMAISSSITINFLNSLNAMNITHNKAMNGGGFYFKLNTVFTILKSDPNTSHHEIVVFDSNLAHENGGAIYLSDDGMCTLSSVSDCSFQVCAMYQPMPFDYDLFDSRCTSILFYNNTAKDRGNSLFGGLLNMCTVSTFAEPNINNVNMDYSFSNGSLIVSGTEYLQSISNIIESDISSEPVRVCFCRERLPDCTFQPNPIEIRRGQQKNVSITLAVVDQLYNPLNDVIVYSDFGSGNFLCQHHLQNMDGKCKKIDFAVVSFNDTEELILSLKDGPCEHNPDSKANLSLHFSCSRCPVGFEEDDTRTGCYCSCDSKLFPYFTNCSGETIVREENIWITNINASGSDTTYHYLIHPYCPLNYCQPPSSRIRINLNTPNGVDLQCADNRSGLLCSTCLPGLSLSLGSSRCIRCPDHWPINLAVIITCACLAGLLLVAFLLIFNLTVAVGTLNAIIFYSNIVFANQSSFFPSTTSKFVTIFISWLNLEIGFDTCFFNGLDTFAKTFIQLAFPGYVILLVILVIILSEHNRKFAQLISRRNPVATLTTLILLSFAKLLNNIIASLSFTVLKYPTSRGNEVVWLYDASVFYLKGKHIALFSIALLILFAGVFYTTILFLWQWLLRLQDNKMFAWLKYQKLCHFIEPYQAPYAFAHRYWTGLLLLARVLLYIVFSLNVERDPQMPLIAIIFTVSFLLFFKSMFVPKLYKKRLLGLLEMIMFYNLLTFSALSSFYTSNGQEKSQSAIAATSVSITFTLLLVVLAFHVYKYSCLESIISKREVFKRIKMTVLCIKKEQAPDNNIPPSPAVVLQQTTYSVVEILKK